MCKEFVKWANNNIDELMKKGINTDKIYITEENILSKGAYVDHSTCTCIGRISISESGYIDMEIIQIETEITIMIAHYEQQNEVTTDLINTYTRIMLQTK
jgi:hypothetical protein